MIFPDKYFQKITYTPQQIKKYMDNAKRDLDMASEIKENEVVFMFCYNSIIKLGIAIIAEKGYKVRSIPGHHYHILNTLEELTGLSNEIKHIQRVRNKRNIDLYEGGATFTEKEAKELLKITKKIFNCLNR